MAVVRAGEGGNGDVLITGHKVSDMKDEHFLEIFFTALCL